MKADQLSQTAAFIAIKFYGLTQDEPYRSLFDEQTLTFYDRLVEALPAPLNRYHNVLKKNWVRPLFRWSEELLLPGDLMHILMRKYYLTRMLHDLKNDYEQIIILGAGFDHTAAIYSTKGVTCLEIDAPRMAELKTQFLQQYGYLNKNTKIQAGHFIEDSMADILQKNPAISVHKKTMILAEGFFDYLPENLAKGILSDINDHFQQKVTLLSTAFALDELHIFRRFVFKTGVRMVGETLLLDHSLSDFLSLLQEFDFIIEETLPGSQMKDEVLSANAISLPILDGFYLIRAVLK